MDDIKERGWPIKTSTTLHIDGTHANFEVKQVYPNKPDDFYIRINTQRYGSDATLFLTVDQLQNLQNAIETALETHERSSFALTEESGANEPKES